MMMTMMNHNSIETVYTSWDRIKRIPNYKEEFGLAVFQRIYEISPRLGIKFYTTTSQPPEPDRIHAKKFGERMDLLVHLLGPDIEPLVIQLLQVGEQDKTSGIITSSKQYAIVGEALVQALHNLTTTRTHNGEDYWKSSHDEAWKQFWKFQSHTMIRGARKKADKNVNENIKNHKVSCKQQQQKKLQSQSSNKRTPRIPSSKNNGNHQDDLLVECDPTEFSSSSSSASFWNESSAGLNYFHESAPTLDYFHEESSSIMDDHPSTMSTIVHSSKYPLTEDKKKCSHNEESSTPFVKVEDHHSCGRGTTRGVMAAPKERRAPTQTSSFQFPRRRFRNANTKDDMNDESSISTTGTTSTTNTSRTAPKRRGVGRIRSSLGLVGLRA